MNQQALVFSVDAPDQILPIFELFDIWEPRRLADETGINVNRIKYLSKLRSAFLQQGDKSEPFSDNQRETLQAFHDALHVSEAPKLQALLPKDLGGDRFTFVDLFAGIGGLRRPFDEIGGKCLLTCEWDDYAQKTYKANWKSPKEHRFISDIKEITEPEGKTGKRLANFIQKNMPQHDVLLAGFPCQPFSIAGVSKKNSLTRAHGFECEDQGQLFFDICRILSVNQPPVAILENVKNLKSHNKGTTFQVIKEMLTNLPDHQQTLFGSKSTPKPHSYWIANLGDEQPDPKIIDGQHFVPQHRERIVLVCIRADLVTEHGLDTKIDLANIANPKNKPSLSDILDKNSEVDEKYTLSQKLWNYLEGYAKKHQEKGNGFGFGMIHHDSEKVARTLSARYYKDGSEILVNQDDINKRPRRLTPQECARLMGFVDKTEKFRIPVSDTRAYKQFGNSVIVPVFSAIANLIDPFIDYLAETTHKSS